MPTHKVRLHFRSLSLTDVPFDTMLSSAEAVYAPYGIKIEFASGMSMGLSDSEAAKFEQIDGSCTWSISGGEYAELQGLGGTVSSRDIVVFYVNRFSSATLLGCGGHMTNRPACIVAAKARRWDTAHEVGHVLLTSSFTPVHSADNNNLMFATSRTANSTPTLTAAQVTQIKASPCCQRI